jgi:hypothetical protein
MKRISVLFAALVLMLSPLNSLSQKSLTSQPSLIHHNMAYLGRLRLFVMNGRFSQVSLIKRANPKNENGITLKLPHLILIEN